jgi:DNA-directed RNA polymerase I, II, and III subunit RPABC2
MHSSYFDGEPDDNENYKGESDNDDDDDESSLSSQEPENNENDDNNELDGLDGGGAEEGIDLEEIDDDDNDDEFSKENEDENLEEEENYEETETKVKKVKTIPTKNIYKKPLDLIDDDDDDDDDGEQYLQKFEQSVNDNYILNFHPESVLQNYNEILTMTNVIRNDNGIIIDKLHRTIPYLTKYEKARILGQRAKQINSGAYPFVKVPENVIDGYIIAEMELKQKRIPFIIRRPLPNGGSEYWKVQDLEDISF